MRTIKIIGTIVAIVAALFEIGWKIYTRRVPKKISWRRIRIGVLKLIKQIRDRDKFIPDIVIGIGRSGAIFGGLLAGNMGNLPLAIIDRKFLWDKGLKQYVPSNFTHITLNERCQKILIVIGEVYLGQSMTKAIEILKPQLMGKDYRTATLVQHKLAAFQTKYYVFKVTKTMRPAWVITEEYVRREKAEDVNKHKG